MNENCKKYDDMSDVFEYGNISDDEIVKLCNQILLESKDEKNDIILETMYHAVFTAANYRNIADKIEIDSILDYIDYFNEEISDYISFLFSPSESPDGGTGSRLCSQNIAGCRRVIPGYIGGC